LQSILVALL